MNNKKRLFKHTFIVLSIMCCLLLGCTSVIYAFGGFESEITSVSTNDMSAINTGAASASTTEILDTSVSAATAKSSSTSSSPVDNSSNSAGQATATDEKTPTLEDIPPASITISAVGDLMFHQGNLNNAYNPKTSTYDFSGFLEYVKPYLTKSDLTIGNFETVTAGPSYGYTSYPCFNTPDTVLTALSGAGFDVLSTANNHCLDKGITGLSRTLQKIQSNKMVSIGTSTDGKNKQITKYINGIKVSILAYSSTFNGNDAKLSVDQKKKYLSTINEKQIESDIKAVKARGTDVIIVIMHWGNEYQRVPSPTQTALSKKVLAWGADIILGSHPHVIQKSEIVKINGKDKFVIYSMGNFISGYRRTDKADRPNKIYTEDGVIVQLKIDKDPNGGVIIKNVNYVPTWVDKTYVNNRPVFKIIPIPSIDTKESYITNYNKSFIKQSYKNTMEIMAKLK